MNATLFGGRKKLLIAGLSGQPPMRIAAAELPAYLLGRDVALEEVAIAAWVLVARQRPHAPRFADNKVDNSLRRALFVISRTVQRDWGQY